MARHVIHGIFSCLATIVAKVPERWKHNIKQHRCYNNYITIFELWSVFLFQVIRLVALLIGWPTYQVCVFRADQKNKMAALAFDWLRHFPFLISNRWTEFNENWQEARSQCPLPRLCFLGRSEKQDGRPDLWLAETFSTSPLKPLNGIQQNLTGSKISMSSTNFVFFGPISKQKGVANCTQVHYMWPFGPLV